ncbi:MAG: PhzF family phenazine biosynthesis protein [Calditrichia bacterium]
MKILFYQIDAFTDTVFSGNPAAVCPLEEWPDDNLLQNIGAENNLSETAFFVQKGKIFELRWFTPEMEVDLCGHATLASAYVIFHELNLPLEEIQFSTRSGMLKVRREGDLFSLDFPATPPLSVDPPQRLSEGLGLSPLAVFKSRDYLAVYSSEEHVRSIQPDFGLLKTLDGLGVCITAPGEDVDFVSRFFAPKAGVPEDPVTGSAHTTLIPYWAKELNKQKLHARQISRRGGELFCEDRGERVIISGRAVKFSEGFIFV